MKSENEPRAKLFFSDSFMPEIITIWHSGEKRRCRCFLYLSVANILQNFVAQLYQRLPRMLSIRQVAHPQQSSSHVRYEIQEYFCGGKGESGYLAAYSF